MMQSFQSSEGVKLADDSGAINNKSTTYSVSSSRVPLLSLNTQSLRTMELVRELFNELTLVHAEEPRPVVESQAKVKQVRSGLDGLLKVLIWRLEGSIS